MRSHLVESRSQLDTRKGHFRKGVYTPRPNVTGNKCNSCGLRNISPRCFYEYTYQRSGPVFRKVIPVDFIKLFKLFIRLVSYSISPLLN